MPGRGTSILILFLTFLVVFFVAPASWRPPAFTLLSGVLGLVASYLGVFAESQGTGYPFLLAILASGAFFALVVSVLLQQLGA